MRNSTPTNVYSSKLTPRQGEQLLGLLQERGYEFFDTAYASYSARKNNVSIVFYKSNKLVIQGKGTAEFVEFTLEPLILQEAKIGYEDVLEQEYYAPRIGVDESGKGDFFGPLCIAGVYVNESIIRAWKNVDIQDSKNIKDDRKIAKIAQIIRTTPGVEHTVVVIGNKAYNRLYEKIKTINRILAWGHARVIENMLERSSRMNPPPVKAISDQFAATETTVQKALMCLGKNLPLVQMHKAESDIAVAAASIIARDSFVTQMAKISAQFGMTFPKGATSVIGAGKKFVQLHGKDALPLVAKMHFRTSYQVLGIPIPPKQPWFPKKHL